MNEDIQPIVISRSTGFADLVAKLYKNGIGINSTFTPNKLEELCSNDNGMNPMCVSYKMLIIPTLSSNIPRNDLTLKEMLIVVLWLFQMGKIDMLGNYRWICYKSHVEDQGYFYVSLEGNTLYIGVLRDINPETESMRFPSCINRFFSYKEIPLESGFFTKLTIYCLINQY